MGVNYQPKYTSWEELKILFPKLTTTSLTAAQVNGTFVAKAEGLINGHLAKKYTVPFSPAPQQIRSMAQDLSFYYIGRRFFTQHAKKDDNDWLASYKKDVMDELKAINKGESVIVTNSGVVITERTDQQQIWSDVTDYTPTMDHRNPIDQNVDTDLLDAEDEADDSSSSLVRYLDT